MSSASLSAKSDQVFLMNAALGRVFFICFNNITLVSSFRALPKKPVGALPGASFAIDTRYLSHYTPWAR